MKKIQESQPSLGWGGSISLIRLNDYGWLDLAQLFVDSTDALVNASKYYLIHFKEIENVKKIKKLGLLHNGKKGSPKRFKQKLNKILESEDLDEETEKVLKLALKNSKIHCRKVFNNIIELERAIEKIMNIMFLLVFLML